MEGFREVHNLGFGEMHVATVKFGHQKQQLDINEADQALTATSQTSRN
jgi:hypothetical protein